uniref:Uncharacterized protein n=1 Tax=Arundo donax TaxID=35708 RepID=A0A0A8XPV4_ARUDO
MSCSSVQSSEPQKVSIPSFSVPLATLLFSSTFTNLSSPILGRTMIEGSFSVFLWMDFLGSLLGAVSWQSGGNDSGSWYLCLFDNDLPSMPLLLFPISISQRLGFSSRFSLFL